MNTISSGVSAASYTMRFGRNDHGSAPSEESPHYPPILHPPLPARELARIVSRDSFEQMERDEQSTQYPPIFPPHLSARGTVRNLYADSFEQMERGEPRVEQHQSTLGSGNFERENRSARQNRNLETDAFLAEFAEEGLQVVPIFRPGDRLIFPAEVRNARSDTHNPLFNFMTPTSLFEVEPDSEPRRVTFEATADARGEATGIDQLLNLAIDGEERAQTTRLDSDEAGPDGNLNLNHPVQSRLHRSEHPRSGRLMGRDRASVREAQNAAPRFESQIENRDGVGVARPHYDLA